MTTSAHDFQAEILKAIAQETRLSILELLRDWPATLPALCATRAGWSERAW